MTEIQIVYNITFNEYTIPMTLEALEFPILHCTTNCDIRHLFNKKIKVI